jgi:hypothetical protein
MGIGKATPLHLRYAPLPARSAHAIMTVCEVPADMTTRVTPMMMRMSMP